MMSQSCVANSNEMLPGLHVQKHHLYPSVQLESKLMITFEKCNCGMRLRHKGGLVAYKHAHEFAYSCYTTGIEYV